MRARVQLQRAWGDVDCVGGAGASPFAGDKITNVPTDIGSVLNYSIAVWQKNLGILVGAFVVLFAIGLAIAVPIGIVQGVLEAAGQEGAGILVALLGRIVGQAIQLYIGIGLAQMMLKLARNQPTEFGDLFGGGPRFLPALGVSILFGLAVAGGFILLIIPGIIVLLVWWPCYYLVVDSKSTVMDSFGLSREITRGNLATTFLVWLVGIGVTGIGLLACCVGVFEITLQRL